MVQIADLCCKVKINSDFFVSFWYVLVSDVSTNYHCFMRFIYLQDLKGFFYQRNGHICYCFRITEFISKM